jgi:hypothetical protein
MLKPQEVKSGTDKKKILDLLSEYGTMIWPTLKWLRNVVQWWAIVNIIRESLGSTKAENFLTG